MVIVGKRGVVFYFDRSWIGRALDVQLVQPADDLVIEVSHRPGFESHQPLPAVDMPDPEPVLEEVEIDFEATRGVRH
jgi:hypothetical protein